MSGTGIAVAGEGLRAPESSAHDEAHGFTAAMRLLASGVVMVTTWMDERPWGLTISACCSLSAEPPQVLISLGSHTTTSRLIGHTEEFGIALLSTDHLELAQVGAAMGVPKYIDDYCDGPGDRVGPPCVRGALYHLDCAVTASHEIADHTVFIGRVVRAHAGSQPGTSDPLIYFDRAYRKVGSGVD